MNSTIGSRSSIATHALLNEVAEPAPEDNNLKGYDRLGRLFIHIKRKAKSTHNAQLENLRNQAARIPHGNGLAALNNKLDANGWGDNSAKIFSTNELRNLMQEVRQETPNHPMPVEIEFARSAVDTEALLVYGLHQTEARADEIVRDALTCYSNLRPHTNLFEAMNTHLQRPNADSLIDKAGLFMSPQFGTEGMPTGNLTEAVKQLIDIAEDYCLPGAGHEITLSDQNQNGALKATMQPAYQQLLDSMLGLDDEKSQAINDFIDNQLRPIFDQAVNETKDLKMVQASDLFMSPQFGTEDMTTGNLNEVLSQLKSIGLTYCIPGADKEIKLDDNAATNATLKHGMSAAMRDMFDSLDNGTDNEKRNAINNFIDTHLTKVFDAANEKVQTVMEQVQLNHRDDLVRAALLDAADEVGAMLAREE